MKERPILFSGAMVRAILDGRKTQTRRVVKPQPRNPEVFGVSPVWGQGVHSETTAVRGARPGLFCLHAAFDVGGKRVDRYLPSPYGKPGDRLWVKETAYISPLHFVGANSNGATHPDGRVVQYVASNPDGDAPESYGIKKTPSIFMPRWASRITLEVTAVRVERLGDITMGEVFAEGCGLSTDKDDPGNDFAHVWNSLNAKRGYSWEYNPWVWVITFARVAQAVAA